MDIFRFTKDLCDKELLVDVAPLGKAAQSSLSKWSKPDDAQRAVIDFEGGGGKLCLSHE
jgi:hypothetical protein